MKLNEMGPYLANRNANRNVEHKIVRRAPIDKPKKCKKTGKIAKGVVFVLALMALIAYLVVYNQAKADLYYEELSAYDSQVAGVKVDLDNLVAIDKDGNRVSIPTSIWNEAAGKVTLRAINDEIFHNNIVQPGRGGR